MNLLDRLTELYKELETAIEYDDWDIVEEVREELSIVIQDIDSSSPIWVGEED